MRDYILYNVKFSATMFKFYNHNPAIYIESYWAHKLTTGIEKDSYVDGASAFYYAVAAGILPAVKYFFNLLSAEQKQKLRDPVLHYVLHTKTSAWIAINFDVIMFIWDSFDDCSCCSIEMFIYILRLRRKSLQRVNTLPPLPLWGYIFDNKVIKALEKIKRQESGVNSNPKEVTKKNDNKEECYYKNSHRILDYTEDRENYYRIIFNLLISLYRKYFTEDDNNDNMADSAKNVLQVFWDLRDEKLREKLVENIVRLRLISKSNLASNDNINNLLYFLTGKRYNVKN